jgi:N-acetylglucosamine-6-phosphate deacetylase
LATRIINGTLVTPHETLAGHTLVVEAGAIAALAPAAELPEAAGDEVIDARRLWVAPGLIDVHVHGAVGNDTMDATPAALAAMARFFAQHGVTGFLPTTAAAPPEILRASIANLASCPVPGDGARALGLHIEGPYLNRVYAGAQPPQYLRDADPAEYEGWLASGQVRLITVAPERAGSMAFIRRGVEAGVEFAVGHSQASFEEMSAAADLGLRQASHTFNGMLGLHHRDPGTVGAVLADDRLYAQIIPDGVHLHPSVVKIVIRAKGIERTILVTDSVRAAGLGDGEYTLAGEPITVRDGICRTTAGGLAGSTLTLDNAIRNVMRFAGVSLGQALTMSSATPAEAMGWKGRKGVLAPGADADVILLDSDLKVRLTMVAGRTVYRAPGRPGKE